MEDINEGAETLDIAKLVDHPLKYIKALDREGKLEEVFPAVVRMKGVRQSPIRHAEGDAFIHTLCTLAESIAETPSDKEFGQIEDENDKLLMILALLYHDTVKKELNEKDRPDARVDHVQESMKHARRDLAKYLSEEDLELVVEMIAKHENILDRRHISYKPNKLYKLFSLGGSLERSQLLLKFTECDALGRKIAKGHEAEWGELEGLVSRNIGLYKLLAQEENAGTEFPAQQLRTGVRNEIKALLRSAGWEG